LLLQALTAPYRAKKALEEEGSTSSEMTAEINRMIEELNENFHTSIEDVFKPFLESMLLGDLAFLNDPQRASQFYWGIAVQYTRTNHIKGAKRAMPPEQFAYYLKVANVLSHIFATNAGFSMFAGREKYSAILIDNSTPTPFVTADQPVINLAANPTNSDLPKRFELYYPLSPQKALLLLEPSSEFLPDSSTVSSEIAHFYNLRMAAHSYRQVFCNVPGELEAIKSELPAFLSCL
jgi:hypothetical protein